MMLLFLKGTVIGLLIAVPVGPVGVLCVHRVITKGKFAGFISGMGAAVADGMYGIVVAFGLTLISNFLIDNRFLIQIFGGIFIIFVGIKIFVTRPVEEIEDNVPNTLFRDFFSTFAVTITNPMTIMGFLAAFAVFDLVNPNRSSFDAWILVSGIISGSCIWWLTLVAVFTFLKSQFNLAYLRVINRLVGVIIGMFGLAVIISSFQS